MKFSTCHQCLLWLIRTEYCVRVLQINLYTPMQMKARRRIPCDCCSNCTSAFANYEAQCTPCSCAPANHPYSDLSLTGKHLVFNQMWSMLCALRECRVPCVFKFNFYGFDMTDVICAECRYCAKRWSVSCYLRVLFTTLSTTLSTCTAVKRTSTRWCTCSRVSCHKSNLLAVT